MNNDLVIPNHIGIIMDGNGRWATERGMIRTMGHKKALETLKELCVREISEVEFLMNLFIVAFQKEIEFLKKMKVKVVFSGRRKPLPDKVLEVMDKIVEDTKNNDKLVLNICLNYGSHAEIVDTTKKICEMYKTGKIELDDIDEKLFESNLYNDLPPLDFVIRTSGELRLSNFMMWQASYAEFYFPKTYFPDFNSEEFDKAIIEFNKRNRRFGGVK